MATHNKLVNSRPNINKHTKCNAVNTDETEGGRRRQREKEREVENLQRTQQSRPRHAIANILVCFLQ